MPSDEQIEKDLKYLEVKNAALDISAKRTDMAWKNRAIEFMNFRTQLERWKYYLLCFSLAFAFIFQTVTIYVEITKNERVTEQDREKS